ncbi:hypothetical protein TRFO_09312 [Tritrichomonas foetus]|uniref:Uncharacterized protein n=1 Tax=Tritrichomonas foetus TaxID=1144522 RepID=A0A1J4JET4_9EUKA|nr:hypothetical protein TRFO_09312 [Tritrichomonas foetus]|eukprot:OHS97616.1 hypothetical protein TRFO_09312 [Tritrichomonas foetus]
MNEKEIAQIEEQTQEEFVKLLENPDFDFKLHTFDKELIDSLFQYYDLVISYLFEGETKNLKLLSKCKYFLLSPKSWIKKRFLNDTNLKEYLTNFPKKFKEKHHTIRLAYSMILESFLKTKDFSINTDFASAELFENLISVCDFNTSYELLEKLITDDNQKISYYLIGIHFSDILSKYLIGDKILNFNVQKLFNLLVNNNWENYVADSLTKDALFIQFLNSTFERPNVYQNFDFILKIYKHSTRYPHISNWKTLNITIASRMKDFRSIVQKTQNWCMTANISLHIINEYLLYTKKCTQSDKNILFDLVEKFFSMPRCTILHLSTLSFLKTLDLLNCLDEETIRQSHLVTHIVENYKMRENQVVYAYWGPIRKMSEIVAAYVNKKDLSEWDLIVSAKNKEIQEILGEEEMVSQKQSWIQKYLDSIPFAKNLPPSVIYGICAVYLIVVIYFIYTFF